MPKAIKIHYKKKDGNTLCGSHCNRKSTEFLFNVTCKNCKNSSEFYKMVILKKNEELALDISNQKSRAIKETKIVKHLSKLFGVPKDTYFHLNYIENGKKEFESLNQSVCGKTGVSFIHDRDIELVDCGECLSKRMEELYLIKNKKNTKANWNPNNEKMKAEHSYALIKERILKIRMNAIENK